MAEVFRPAEGVCCPEIGRLGRLAWLEEACWLGPRYEEERLAPPKDPEEPEERELDERDGEL